jgi:hypothetical protein
MNAALARFALRLLGHRPWRSVLLMLAVSATSAWLAGRTITSRAAIEHAEAEAQAWPAVIATTTSPVEAACCAPVPPTDLGAIPGVGTARVVLECRIVGHELEVGRAEEAEAVAKEAAATLGDGWEVSTRSRMRTAAIAALERQAGLATLSATPIVLSLLLVLLALGHGGTETPELVGKLKLVGFTTRQCAWLLVVRSLGPCVLGCVLGVALASIAMATGWLGWLREMSGLGHSVAFGWRTILDATLGVVAFVLAPCLVAAAAPAVRLARDDPARILEAG